MKTIFVMLLAALLTGSLSAQDDSMNEVVGSYLELKNSLFKADTEAAAHMAAVLAAKLQTSENRSLTSGEKSKLLQAAHTIAGTFNIEKQRAALSILSADLWQAVNKSATVETSLYYFVCPMKKSYWISEAEVIKNPFYGKQMAACGRIVEKINQ